MTSRPPAPDAPHDPRRDLRVAGAVLTGGASRRMGTDKALVVVDGVVMARRVHDALVAAGCDPVVAVGGDAAALGAHGLTVVPDAHPGEGPLGAIITGLEHALGVGADVLVVLACDLPDADPRAIAAVCAPFRGPGPYPDAVVPRGRERRHMHHGAWHVRALPVLRAAFENGERAPRRTLDLLTVCELSTESFDPRWLRDLDTPDDLHAHRRSHAP